MGFTSRWPNAPAILMMAKLKTKIQSLAIVYIYLGRSRNHNIFFGVPVAKFNEFRIFFHGRM